MKQTDKLEQIYKASLDLLETTSVHQTYDTIIHWAMKLVGAKYGSIFEINDNQAKRIYTSDKTLFAIQPRKDGGAYVTYQTKKPYLKQARDIAKIHPELIELGVTSDISIPLSYGNQAYGVLSVLAPKGKPFRKKDLETIKIFSPLASFALRQQRLKKQLQDLLSERDLFISIAAHEMYSPLTSILSYTQLLKRKVKDKQSSLLIDKLLHSEKRLQSLIDEFLNLQQITTGKIHYNYRKTNIITVIQNAIEHFKLRYPHHSVILERKNIDTCFYVYGDADKLLQSILNILTNAGKFSDRKDPIHLTVTPSEKQISIEIRDHGDGIPRNELNRIFQQYYRSKKTKKQGMGIGLFLVKHIIDAHDGIIEINSKIKKGTTIIIKLPSYAHRNRKSI